MADSAPATVDRVKNVIPLGVAMFCAEYEWEFLSKLGTATAAADSTGYWKVSPPTDFFKPVVLWTAKVPEICYINRVEFANRQVGASGSETPYEYTVIGESMYLARPSTGDAISLAYTRKSNNIGFADIPGQYHHAVVLATCTHLTPMVLKRPGGDVANPAFDQSEQLYDRAVNKAVRMEMTNKGRPGREKPTALMLARNGYA
jgi:hypothetical protein